MLGHMVTLCLNFEEPPCFPKWLYQFTFPPTVCGFQLLHILPYTCYCPFDNWHPSENKVKFLMVQICTSLMTNDFEHLVMCLLLLLLLLSHFSRVWLQCMKVKSESEVAQSCPTCSDPMDCSLPWSSVHGIFQATVLEGGAIAFSVSCVQGCLK